MAAVTKGSGKYFWENERVWRLHESFGFHREAEFRDHVLKAGAFRNVIGLGLLRADWPEVRTRAEAMLAAKGHAIPTLGLIDPRERPAITEAAPGDPSAPSRRVA